MYELNKISFRDALRMIEVVVAEAEKMEKHIAVAVCGPEGESIAFLRMDRAAGAASTIAQNKAYTCAIDRKSTRDMGDFMNNNARPPAFWGNMRITGFGGGFPILHEGWVIGGIGVSGLSEEEDEILARFGIDSVFGK
jgi:glc operon protein GlcG